MNCSNKRKKATCIIFVDKLDVPGRSCGLDDGSLASTALVSAFVQIEYDVEGIGAQRGPMEMEHIQHQMVI